MDRLQSNIQRIKKLQEQFGYMRPFTIMGPTGPKGEKGERGEKGEQGIQGITGPKGEVGSIGPKGDKGDKGDTGPKGENGQNGKDGTSVTILGSYASESELKKNHPKGKEGESYLVEDNLYVWSEEDGNWKDVGVIRGPKGETGPKGEKGEKGDTGPKGDKGDVGPTGPLNIPVANFLTTIADLTSDNTQVLSEENFPLSKITIDTESNYYINTRNDTIIFYNAGLYKVDFMVSVRTTSPTVDKQNTNVISVGFKKVGEPVVYFGTSTYGDPAKPTLVTGTGIIEFKESKQWCQLTNLGKYPVIIESPKVDALATDATVTSPVVSITIQRLK